MFEGRGAVITGAASGIGLGLAREAAKRGMRLVLADLDRQALEQVAQALPDAIAVPTDVTDMAAVDRLAAVAFERLDSVDLLFNNAGIMATGLMWEIEPRRWDASLTVNVGGVLNGIRAFVPRMLKAGHAARIVNTASVGGFNPAPLMAPYSATKFAVVALTESLKGELDMIEAPIAVSLLAPGPVRSAIFDDPFSGEIHPATQGFVDNLRSMIGEHGMDPEPFAERVLDGIARGDYWIVPQPEALDPMLERRHKMIADRAQPAFGYL